MTNAIVYYRSRPSESEASEIALHLQREAVRAEVEAGRIRIVGEFIEQESEASDHALHSGHEPSWPTVERDELLASSATRAATRPAYLAALWAARAHEKACLVIVSSAAIGSGEPFKPPEVGPEVGEEPWPPLVMLSVALVATPPEIPVPAGAPGPLCLWAEFRAHEGNTLVYLGNAGVEPLAALTVGIDSLSMFEFYRTEPDQRWAQAFSDPERRWGVLLAGHALLIDILDHIMWDMVNRYRVTYSNGVGGRWTAEADRLAFNADRLSEDPAAVWLGIAPPCPADRPVEGP